MVQLVWEKCLEIFHKRTTTSPKHLPKKKENIGPPKDLQVDVFSNFIYKNPKWEQP